MKRYFIFIFLLGATILMRAQDTFLWANADSKEAERRYNEIYGIGGEGYERNQRIQQYNKELYEESLKKQKAIGDAIQRKLDEIERNRRKNNSQNVQNNPIERRSGGIMFDSGTPQNKRTSNKKISKNNNTKKRQQTTNSNSRLNAERIQQYNLQKQEYLRKQKEKREKEKRERAAKIQRDRNNEYHRLEAETRHKSMTADWHSREGAIEMERLHNSNNLMNEVMRTYQPTAERSLSAQHRSRGRRGLRQKANKPNEWRLDPNAKVITQYPEFNAEYRQAFINAISESEKELQVKLKPITPTPIWVQMKASMPKESLEINLAKMSVECEGELPQYIGFNQESNSYIFASQDKSKIFSIEKDGSSYLSLSDKKEEQTDIIKNLQEESKFGASINLTGLEGNAEIGTDGKTKKTLSAEIAPKVKLSYNDQDVKNMVNFSQKTIDYIKSQKENNEDGSHTIDTVYYNSFKSKDNVTGTQEIYKYNPKPNNDKKNDTEINNKLGALKVYAKTLGYKDVYSAKVEYSRIVGKNYSFGGEFELKGGIDVKAEASASASLFNSKIEMGLKNEFATITSSLTYTKRGKNGDVVVSKTGGKIAGISGIFVSSKNKQPIPGLSLKLNPVYEIHHINTNNLNFSD
ncbi:MAG: hypothetical protein E7080_06440 [Bacteroidales bacterium]|nr:hypothetical protein [Bacteroidales bacterium]